jgi:hypothetical protein
MSEIDSEKQPPLPYTSQVVNGIATSDVLAATPPGTSPQTINKTIEVFFSKTDGLDINLNNRNLYHVNIHGGRRNPGLAIYGGYDAHGPQLASSRFKSPKKTSTFLSVANTRKAWIIGT